MFLSDFCFLCFLTTSFGVEIIIPDNTKQDILHSRSYADAYHKYMNAYYGAELIPNYNQLGSQNKLSLKSKNNKRERKFISNIDMIRKHNSDFDKGASSYLMKVNKFLVMEDVELKLYAGDSTNYTQQFPNIAVGEPLLKSSDVPDSWDWAEKCYVTQVKNQRMCGSCWAFATVALVEYGYKKATGKLVSLSEQEILDCVEHSTSQDPCEGMSTNTAYSLLKDTQRLATMKSYPYKYNVHKCDISKYGNALSGKLKISGRKSPALNTENEDSLVSLLYEYGPVMVSVKPDKTFHLYGGGIFTRDNCGDIAHVATATAYTKQYFRVKNSWGPDWGDGGFINIARGKSSQTCGLLTRQTVLTYNFPAGISSDPYNEAIDKQCDYSEATPSYICQDVPKFVNSGECAGWVAGDYCTKPLRAPSMAILCPVSCNFCDPTEEEEEYSSGYNTEPPPNANICQDRHTTEYCDDYVSSGDCDRGNLNEVLALSLCIKSCGLCDESEGKNYAYYGPADAKCRDDTRYEKSGQCAEWVKLGECSAFPRFMLLHCRKSCGLCSSKTKGYGYLNDDNQDCGDSGNLGPSGQCVRWARKDYCNYGHKHESFMKKHCAKSCAFCGGTSYRRNDWTTDTDDDKTCEDNDKLIEKCADWVADGYCKTGHEFENFMSRSCARSCGYCEEGENSSDSKETENESKETENDSKETENDSKETENDDICKDVEKFVEKCPTWAGNGYCETDKYEKFMTKYCAQSCGNCKKNRICTDAENYVEKCPIWAKRLYCNAGHKYENVMSKYCAKSCRHCKK